MTLNLNGNWCLSSADGGGAGIDMQIPGDIHSALIDAKQLADPYYARNELDVQWVGKADWVLERTFDASPALLKGRQFLTLESADTFVRIFLNGNETGLCDNYFKRWRFDITESLKAGKNTIKLVFESAERHAAELAAVHPYAVPDSKAPVYSPHRNFVRKIQCHGGWDWGPCIMAFGIYGKICIEQTADCLIDYLEFDAKPEKSGSWLAAVTVTCTAVKDCKKQFKLKITKETETVPAAEESFIIQLKKGENRFTKTLVVKKPELWHPAFCSAKDTAAIHAGSMSTPEENILYNAEIKTSGQRLCKKVAFRTLKAVSQNDEYGKSLYFEVNDRKVFAKGSNWIPCDALPSRQTKAKYERLLSDLVAANQNCVRVWGGGQYENDYFYELCDRKGILVWQDFMFSCSLYPVTDEFCASVKDEITHQVKRLQSHPSIAIWCGNNEVLGAFDWYEESRTNRERYLKDYNKLNNDIVGKTIKELDGTRIWWPSSPSAGPDDFADNWHMDGKGDMHYWSVWHEGKQFEAYYDIKPRFVSEFGYQSFPSLEGVKRYVPNSDLNLTSPVMEHHQKNNRGNSIIIENFSHYFRFPEGFGSMLYLSQVQQALAIKTAVDYWRSLRPLCMGAIIWQLNDVWPVASWSSIEYCGKWKLLHYAAKDFFAPLNIALFKKDGKVFVYAYNDTDKSYKAAVLLKNFDFSGKELKAFKQKIMLEQDSSQKVFEFEVSDFDTSSFLYAELGERFATSMFIEEPKKAPLEKPLIKAEVRALESSGKAMQFEIKLKTEKPAFYVSLEAPHISGLFDKNMLTLLPGKAQTVRFTLRDEVLERGIIKKTRSISVKTLQRALRITSLRDTYR
ncbi:MAG: glycoside hydrolase family 2 protein [Spirochaetaceae bacterium]|nr:glycoside hydrolase family 2 protein [Spirochaetaceae bacterium]